jgi:hypothetical protein
VSSLESRDIGLLQLIEALNQVDEPNTAVVLDTDSRLVPVPDWLPPGTQWRALSEFADGLDDDDREALVTAFLHSLRPDAVLVWGSRTGWGVFAKIGRALCQLMQLFAVIPATQVERRETLKFPLCHFRSSFPSLAAVYSEEEEALSKLADHFGVPGPDRARLRVLRAPALDSIVGSASIQASDGTGAHCVQPIEEGRDRYRIHEQSPSFDRGGWDAYLRALAAEPGFLAVRHRQLHAGVHG